ncbi:nitric oxide reductase activation protein NorD [Desulfatitalea alkaliphila]|uniref:VWA domain-containing protein n=1 Tax=Desulfatitalea alkaliphila TaxID=2929485 RepID=A0AA41QZF9_9BACT|nr:VWA domain-containing protein [Desulfatitalea alkaliphila]MCJ8499233.1 VWA domain-containing protein [Desulfatitalea alkaliphila]
MAQQRSAVRHNGVVDTHDHFMALAAPLASRVGWEGVETVAAAVLRIAGDHLPTYVGLMQASAALLDRLVAETGRETALDLYRLAGRIGAADPGAAVQLLESAPETLARLPIEGPGEKAGALLAQLLPAAQRAPLLVARLFRAAPDLLVRLSTAETDSLMQALFTAAATDQAAAIRLLDMAPKVLDGLPPVTGRAQRQALYRLVVAIFPVNVALAEQVFRQSPCLVSAIGMAGLQGVARSGLAMGREGWPPAFALLGVACDLVPRIGMARMARTVRLARVIAAHCPQTAAGFVQRSAALYDRLGIDGLWAFGRFCVVMARNGSGVAVRFPEQSLALLDRLLAGGDAQRVAAIYDLAQRTAGSNPMIAHKLLEASPDLLARIGASGLERFGRAVLALAQHSWTTADALIKAAPDLIDRAGEEGVARMAALGATIAGQNVYGAVGLLEKAPAVMDRLLALGGRPLMEQVLALVGRAAVIHWSVAVRLLEKAPVLIEGGGQDALTALAPQLLTLARRDPSQAVALLDAGPSVLAGAGLSTLQAAASFWAAVGETDGPGAIAGIKACPAQMDALSALGGPEMPAKVYALAADVAQQDPTIARRLVEQAAVHLGAAGLDGLHRIAAEALLLANIDRDKAARFAAGEGLTFADFMATLPRGLQLAQVQPVLFNYLAALLGYRLSIEAGERPDIDARRIVLPAKVREFDDDGHNFTYYKVMATHLEAYLEFGSFDPDPHRLQPLLDRLARRYGGRMSTEADASADLLARFLQLFPEPSLADDLVHLLEDHRIARRLQREYPGLQNAIRMVRRHDLKKRGAPDRMRNGKQRVMERIARCLGDTPSTADLPADETAILALARSRAAVLERPQADFHATLRAAMALYKAVDAAFSDPYRPVQRTPQRIDPHRMQQAIGSFARTARDISDRMHRQEGQQQATAAGAETRGEATRDNPTRARQAPRQSRVPHARRSADGRANPLENTAEAEDQRHTGGAADPRGDAEPNTGMTMSARQIEAALRRLFKETGRTPDEVAKRIRSMAPEQITALLRGNDTEGDAGPLEAEKGTRRYPEWDDGRNGYRENWCRVRERSVPDGDPDFYARTLTQHAGLLKRVRREFQRMRPEALARHTRQPDGEEIDLDAAIESLIDRRVGLSPSENCYQRTEKQQRDMAVAILVDMSKSTKGDTLGFEKQALIILSEALQAVGDAYAIYGFSGDNRDNVDFFRIKDFETAPGMRLRQRIAGIACGLENRDGAALRHTTAILKGREEQTKLIILLSDGKPVDKAYAGRHAIEDTRRALLEARQAGVRTFCITVDRTAPDYLPRMYSHSSWVVIDEVARLPEKISPIFARLTT